MIDIVNPLRLIANDERVDLHARSTAEMAANEIVSLRAVIDQGRIVPVNPDGPMQAAGRDAIEPYVQRGLSKPVSDQWQIAREVYAAMIAAAPPSVKMQSEPVEIRRNPDESIDEIVAKNCKLVHVEQMSADGWFMGIDLMDGGYSQFWFGSKNRKSAVEFRHTETTPPKVVP